MNYVDAFIRVASDCPATAGEIPVAKGRMSVAVIQYDLLAHHPYTYTQEDVLFGTHVRHKDADAGAGARVAFFEKPQPCLRTSPLARRYGWGLHFDPDGRVALYGIDTSEYELVASASATQLMALRSKRA